MEESWREPTFSPLPPARHRRVVYTAVFGGYDDVSPVNPDCGCDFVFFTDRAESVPGGWCAVVVDRQDDSPALANRRFKILAHRYLAQYDESLYVDGRVVLRRCPAKLFDAYLTQHLIAAPYHQDRDCVYDEAAYCAQDGIVDVQRLRTQLNEYSAAGFPRHFGLTENGVLLRRHNSDAVAGAMEAWWSEFRRGVGRDQLSLPFVLWKSGIRVAEIREGPRLSGRYFVLKPHAAMRRSWIRTLVWYVTTNRRRNPAYRLAYRLFRLVSAPLAS